MQVDSTENQGACPRLGEGTGGGGAGTGDRQGVGGYVNRARLPRIQGEAAVGRGSDTGVSEGAAIEYEPGRGLVRLAEIASRAAVIDGGDRENTAAEGGHAGVGVGPGKGQDAGPGDGQATTCSADDARHHGGIIGGVCVVHQLNGAGRCSQIQRLTEGDHVVGDRASQDEL